MGIEDVDVGKREEQGSVVPDLCPSRIPLPDIADHVDLSRVQGLRVRIHQTLAPLWLHLPASQTL